MKTFTNLITTDNISKYLKETLLQHIEIDDFFMVLPDMYFHEKHGSFDNAYAIAQYIYDSIDITDDELNIDVSKFDTFVKYVYITFFEDKKVHAVYDIIENDTLFFDLYFDKTKLNKQMYDILKTIIHEMLHAYEDYNLINNTGTSIQDLVDDKYRLSTLNLQHPNKRIKTIARAIYLFDDQEQHAYISQLEVDVRKIIKDKNITLRQPERYKTIIDELEKTDVWKIYIDIATEIMNADDTTINNTYKMFDKTYKGKSAKRDLLKKYDKFKKKFNTTVSKIIFDVLSETCAKSKRVSIQAKDLK